MAYTEEELDEIMDYNKKPGEGWTWFHICSAHQQTNEDCETCMVGSWVNDIEREADHKLYVENYEAWYKKHNAPDSPDGQILKRIFPGLR